MKIENLPERTFISSLGIVWGFSGGEAVTNFGEDEVIVTDEEI